jgi:hypothetical protein
MSFVTTLTRLPVVRDIFYRWYHAQQQRLAIITLTDEHTPTQTDQYYSQRIATITAIATDEQRAARCLWCWQNQYPEQQYPYLTSHLCQGHKDQELTEWRARRQATRTTTRKQQQEELACGNQAG